MLNRSRFICDKESRSTYKSLTDLEAEGIWFIYKTSWANSNMWINVWVDNWGSVWQMKGNYNNSGEDTIVKQRSGFSKPMSDMCIENIVSKKWPLPNPVDCQLDGICDALTAYVSMFLELETSKQQKARLRLRIMSHSWKIEDLEETVEALTSELHSLKAAEPVKEEDTLGDLMSFFEPPSS